mmetsp:Transcript_20463/g.28744  ORF Transcript_20463/g.28744 Transcript_20463/m.28744 type:complete len:88 (-) Transcript_20463:192-455(-)
MRCNSFWTDCPNCPIWNKNSQQSSLSDMLFCSYIAGGEASKHATRLKINLNKILNNLPTRKRVTGSTHWCHLRQRNLLQNIWVGASG